MRARCLMVLLAVLGTTAAADEFEGVKSEWQGFVRYDFSVDGRRCWVVAPHRAAEGRPWIWRARFFGHEPQADIALLKEGFHLTYCDVAGLFGSPRAVQHWNAFYKLMVGRYKLSPKPALEGMSRGGLIVFNWAAANPHRVACIYADAPVCDFKSWPAGRGQGKGAQRAWQECLTAYGLTEQAAWNYKGNPVDRLQPLAAAGVPLLHIVGDVDQVVPVEENTAVVEREYRKLGGSIHVIHKPKVGHHPHSLPDPGPIVAFVREHTQPNVRLRGELQNSRICFEHRQRGHVAFMGGSITEMEGYRPLVCRELQRRFPQTTFSFTPAGIASTCSTTGAFRLGDEVLSRGPVDLFFIEFAVNDDQDAGHARRECIRGMEGIVRQVRRHNPHADIVIVHFVNPAMLKQLQAGKTPLTMKAHTDVAQHYGVSTIHLGKDVAEQIRAGKMTWADYGGTHPKPFGNKWCAKLVTQLFDAAWSETLSAGARPSPYPLPDPIDARNYERGRFVPFNQAELSSGWRLETPTWSSIPGNKRRRFSQIPMLCAETPGAQLSLRFSGKAVGAYVVAGPDAGVVESRIDGGEWRRVDLYHRFSKGLHYPRTVMFASDLQPGEHQLELRMVAPADRPGSAVRMVKFVAN